jgi:hypothetical protein
MLDGTKPNLDRRTVEPAATRDFWTIMSWRVGHAQNLQEARGKLGLLLFRKMEAVRSPETSVDFYGLHGVTSQKTCPR